MIFRTHTTGIHYTDEIVEWAVLRKNRAGTEKIREGSLPIPSGFFEQENAPLFPTQVLSEIRSNFRGVVTVSLASSKLLMRVLELPSDNAEELRAMVELQMDQASPFPADQLTISHEVLDQKEGHSRVLAMAAPRKTVDELGALFKEKGVYIRSLDAEVLAWWSLLVEHGDVPKEGRVILILEEHTEFSMIVVDDGVPIRFRSLELFHDFSDEAVMQEIIEEIRYTLLSLETEYGPCDGCRTVFWHEADVPEKLTKLLGELCENEIEKHPLQDLPPVSEGLALRSAERTRYHAELVPREWVELQRRRQIMRVASIASIAIFSIWLAVVSITGTVFAVRKSSVRRIRADAAIYAGPAREAQAAREEMRSLETYADRSRSALEVLREITDRLPDSVEINSFSYSKGNAVALRGSALRSEPIYEYFNQLGQSDLFESLKNEKVDTQVRQSGRIEAFSITATLPQEAREDQP